MVTRWGKDYISPISQIRAGRPLFQDRHHCYLFTDEETELRVWTTCPVLYSTSIAALAFGPRHSGPGICALHPPWWERTCDDASFLLRCSVEGEISSSKKMSSECGSESGRCKRKWQSQWREWGKAEGDFEIRDSWTWHEMVTHARGITFLAHCLLGPRAKTMVPGTAERVR